ncbi:acyl-CoA-binding protein [Paraburkholderia sp. DHOC27]|uniref:acyl-CoA-binding protein n=1 Tax=Paraburkholderia sp. DHOC27 TaxID=2303330 RepID=UPI00216AC568|nr:acyl-CoA-binding protein [Paraburkholderia sp. DHOC27]
MAALLIHGLGGTQFDLGSMHKRLQRCGIETHSLTLPGHGVSPDALNDVRAEHWIDAVTQKYRELVDQYDQVHVVGMCMGALLAAILCARERHTKGRLVTLAPPVFLDGWSTPWYRAARHLLYYVPLLPARMKVEEGEPYGIKNALVRNIVKAKVERGDNFHYRWVPLTCIREVDRLRAIVLQEASQIRCPVLVLHSREDELTSLKSAEFIERAVPDARVVVLENSYHLICIDNDREQVANSLLAFIGATPTAKTAVAPVARCTPEEARALVERYIEALREQRYEDLFALFSWTVRWDQRGENPLARVYPDRNALIELFSCFMSWSDGTFAAAAAGTPEFLDDTATLPVRSRATAAGQSLSVTGTLAFMFGDQRIQAVTYRPDEPATEDAFWRAAAAAHQPAANTGSELPVGGAVRPDVLQNETLDKASPESAALNDAFEKAVKDATRLAARPSNSDALRLYALYKQSRSGDAAGERPPLTQIVARAKYDAWTQLRGTSRDIAMQRYVAIVSELTGR